MRTITFEVEVDDKIFDTMVPNIYDEAVKNAPAGRLFLCIDNTSGEKLMGLHRDVTAEGDKETPWFDYYYLPDEMRVVKDSKGIVANGKSAAELVAESDAEQHEDLVNAKLDEIKRELSNLYSGLNRLGEAHNNAHVAVLDHFNQLHEALVLEFAKVPTMHTPHDAQEPSDNCCGNQVFLRALDVLECAIKK